MSEELTFGERLSAAMADVAYLEKTGWNGHFKYSFVQESEVKRACSEALRKHGLIISSVKYAPVGDCTGKAAVISCYLTVAAAKGDGVAYFEGVGSGTDSSDKAPMKAMAAGLKYALTSGFLIATGDDPEEDGGTADKTAGKKAERPAMAPPALPREAKEEAKADEASEVNALATQVGACTTLAELAKLKVAVSKMRGKPGFDGLADAFKAKGKALKEAAESAEKEAA